MNAFKLTRDLKYIKKRIKNTVRSNLTQGDYVRLVRESDFGLTMRRLNLARSLDNLKVNVVGGKVDISINGKVFSSKTFTKYLNKGDLYQAYRSIGIPQEALKNPICQTRIQNFRLAFENSLVQKVTRNLEVCKVEGARIKELYGINPKTQTEAMSQIGKNKAFQRRYIQPLFNKIKRNPRRFSALGIIAVGSLSTFTAVLVAKVYQHIREENGCWVMPQFGNDHMSRCKVELLTCNESYKKYNNCGILRCSSVTSRYNCFSEGARQSCPKLKGQAAPFCNTAATCSWACNSAKVCHPPGTVLQCIDHDFTSALVALTGQFAEGTLSSVKHVMAMGGMFIGGLILILVVMARVI